MRIVIAARSHAAIGGGAYRLTVAPNEKNGKQELKHEQMGPVGSCPISRILSVLSAELSVLDELGAYKAGAHLDATIQQLRKDAGMRPDTNNLKTQVDGEMPREVSRASFKP